MDAIQFSRQLTKCIILIWPLGYFNFAVYFLSPLIMIYNNIQMDTYNYGFTQSHTLYHVSISLLCLLIRSPHNIYQSISSCGHALMISYLMHDKSWKNRIVIAELISTLKKLLVNRVRIDPLTYQMIAVIILQVESRKYFWHWISFKIDWIFYANNLSSLCLQDIFLTRQVYENN